MTLIFTNLKIVKIASDFIVTKFFSLICLTIAVLVPNTLQSDPSDICGAEDGA